jgi:hypothetical protein
MIVELPIFYNLNNTEVVPSYKLYIDYDLVEVRPQTFIGDITFVKCIHKSDEKEYSMVFHSGNGYICALTYEEVKALIEKRQHDTY